MLPTYALEHKVWLPPLSRRYPRAKVWVTEGIWSVPVDLPLEWLGIEKTGTLTVDRRGLPDDAERTPPWLDELDYRVLRVDTAVQTVHRDVLLSPRVKVVTRHGPRFIHPDFSLRRLSRGTGC